MLVRDNIYGSFNVKEPVLVDLINSKAIQRLKRIAEAPRFQNNDLMISSNRYQHSIGVMLLLRKYGAALEEQMAGLLHDVSHTAFSHTIDRIMGNPEKQDYQDNRHREFVYSTDVPQILKRYGYDVNPIINIKNGRYGLLENQLPDICADRLDYSLRNFAKWENPRAVKPCLGSLITYKGMFVFSSKSAAKMFACNYLNCQIRNWGSLKYNSMEHIFSKLLKIALQKEIIVMNDLLYTDDRHVMLKLEKSKDDDIIALFNVLKHRIRYHTVKKEPDYTNNIKIRYTDPIYLEMGMPVRLSKTDSAFRKRLNTYLRSRPARIRYDYGSKIRKLLQ